MFTKENFEAMSKKILSASSPEEAAQWFHREASKLIMSAIAEGLANVKKQAITTNTSNASIDGWLDYVQGCTADLSWPTPGGRSIQIGLPILQTAKVEINSNGGVNAMISGEISCGGTIRF